jgi:hypothetical protein
MPYTLVVEPLDFPRNHTRNSPLVLRHARDYQDARGPHDMAVLRSDTRSSDNIDKPIGVLNR